MADSLYCTESSNACFDEFDCNAKNNELISLPRRRTRDPNDDGFGPESEERIRGMVDKEIEHLPRHDYLDRMRCGDLDLKFRREAVDWIWKAHAHYRFGPLSLCLSLNYLDRFLSEYQMPMDKSWTVQLLSVACMSLAAKMEEIEVPLPIDLQPETFNACFFESLGFDRTSELNCKITYCLPGQILGRTQVLRYISVEDPKFVFEAKTIKRMELLVLSRLKWKMQAITPFSFIDYFLNKITVEQHAPRLSLLKSAHLILSTIKGIDFLEFKPSQIALAVAISISEEFQAPDMNKAILSFPYVEKERVTKCIELMKDSSLIGNSLGGGSSNPQSPVGVLDAACFSYKTEEFTAGSCGNNSSSCYHDSPDSKRRRQNRPSSKHDSSPEKH